MVKQKKILLRCVDDSVMVMSFVLDDEHGLVREGTRSEIDAEIAKSSSAWSPSKLPILSWHEITDSDIPADRMFREAWTTRGNGRIEHDMVKARNIHRENMRAARANKLCDLDAEYLRADEAIDRARKREIAARKQALRDVTDDPAIESAQTPEELKSVWPDALR